MFVQVEWAPGGGGDEQQSVAIGVDLTEVFGLGEPGQRTVNVVAPRVERAGEAAFVPASIRSISCFMSSTRTSWRIS